MLRFNNCHVCLVSDFAVQSWSIMRPHAGEIASHAGSVTAAATSRAIQIQGLFSFQGSGLSSAGGGASGGSPPGAVALSLSTCSL